jgi:hypothetical protein
MRPRPSNLPAPTPRGSVTGMFHFRRAAFSSGLKSKVGLVLAKTEGFRINLNLDGVTTSSKSHTHPSHS